MAPQVGFEAENPLLLQTSFTRPESTSAIRRMTSRGPRLAEAKLVAGIEASKE